MIECEDGIEVVCNLAQIFGNIFPTTNGALPLKNNISQGWISIPPPTNFSSIPTYTNHQVMTTMQPTSGFIPSLGIFARIPNNFVASHAMSHTILPPIIIPLTRPLYMYTPPPY
jgi:hypothetical protein